MKRIIILGGGFGGLWAARALRDADADVVLIDRSNHHTFQPLLYQVATAGLSAPQIAAPIRHILESQRNCRVLLGEVTRIDVEQRCIYLDDNTARTNTPGMTTSTARADAALTMTHASEPSPQALSYDYLIVATGATHSYFGHDEWAAHAPGLKTLADAMEMRRRILLAFERAEAERDPQARAAWLTFVVIGGGPTGVELAGTLAEIARHTLKNEFRTIDPAAARVVLVEGGPRVLSSYPERLSEKARQQLERLGVEVQTQAPASDIDAQGVILAGERLAARTVLWAAGVQASPLGQQLGAEQDRLGRVKVAATGNLSAHPEVFVIGDLAYFEQDGAPVPGVADVAKQMGTHAAQAIKQMLNGAAPNALPNFRYRHKGSLATIGREAAIAWFPGNIQLSGLVAWLAWLFIHVFFLIGYRNRFIVMIDWAWSYISYQRHARLIIEPTTPINTHPPANPAAQLVR